MWSQAELCCFPHVGIQTVGKGRSLLLQAKVGYFHACYYSTFNMRDHFKMILFFCVLGGLHRLWIWEQASCPDPFGPGIFKRSSASVSPLQNCKIKLMKHIQDCAKVATWRTCKVKTMPINPKDDKTGTCLQYLGRTLNLSPYLFLRILNTAQLHLLVKAWKTAFLFYGNSLTVYSMLIIIIICCCCWKVYVTSSRLLFHNSIIVLWAWNAKYPDLSIKPESF